MKSPVKKNSQKISIYMVQNNITNFNISFSEQSEEWIA